MKRFVVFFLTFALLLGIPVMPAAAKTTEVAQTPEPSAEYEAEVWYEVSTGTQLAAYLTMNTGVHPNSINRPENQNRKVGIRLTADLTTNVPKATSQNCVFYVGHYSDTASEQFPISLVLDLNGHTITDTSVNPRLFGVFSGSTFTLTNGTILANGTHSASGGTIFTHKACDVTLDGVRLVSTDGADRSGGDSCDSSGGSDGGLFTATATGSKLTITNSHLEKTEGIVNEGGLVHMSSGVTATFTNSTFYGGTAVRGGNIYGSASVNLTMTDCTVLGGRAIGSTGLAGRGGNLFYMGTASLTRCHFNGGTSASDGGNVYFQAKPAVLTDCVIENGFAAKTSNNLYVNGGPITIDGGEIAGGFRCQGEATFTGAPKISLYDYTGVTVSAPAVFRDLQPGTKIVLAGTGALSTTDVSDYVAAGYILPALDTALTMDGGILTGATSDTGYCPHCQKTVTWMAYTAGTVTSGHYYAGAMSSVNPGTVAAGSDVVIDIRGTVKVTARMQVKGNVTFLSSVSGGGIWDRTATSSTNDGAVLLVDGQVDIYGGTFNGTATTGNGGTLNAAKGARVTVYHGRLTGGSSTDSSDSYAGGNVFVAETAVFTMKKGMIDSGTSVAGAGNIGYNGTVNLEGGVVLYGNATTNGGNLYAGSKGTLVLSGGTVYDGRSVRGGNLYVAATSCTITISAGLMAGGVASEYGGNAFINNGKFYFTGGAVTGGVATLGGGNLYLNAGFYSKNDTGNLVKKYSGNVMEIGGEAVPEISYGQVTDSSSTAYSGFGGNILLFGDLTLGNAHILGGSAVKGGGDLFIGRSSTSNAPKLEVTPDFTQDLPLYIGTNNNTDAVTKFNLDAYGKPIHGLLTAQSPMAAKLTVENMNGALLAPDETGCLTVCGATVVSGGTETWYTTVQAALEACDVNSYVKLYALGQTLEITEQATVDLNGADLTVTGNGKLYGFDSANDDFDGNGSVTGANVEKAFYAPNGLRYVAVTENGVTTFHRLAMRISHVSLRTAETGMYFKALWQCDAVLAAEIDTFGVASSAADMPMEDFRTDSDTLYTQKSADSFVSGGTVPGALIANILKEGADNSDRANQKVHAAAYVTLTDGTALIGDDYYGAGVSYSMAELIQGINRNWGALSGSQKEDMKSLYLTYEDLMANWDLYHIEAAVNGTAADRPLKVLTIGNSGAVDSFHMLNLVAKSQGYQQEMVIGTLYHSGCAMSRHVTNLETNRADYDLYLSSTATADAPPVILKDFTMLDGILYTDWDVIVLQGSTATNYKEETFTCGDMEKIQNYVNQHKTNPNAVFAWHMYQINPADKTLQDMYETQTGASPENNNYKKIYQIFETRDDVYAAVSGNVKKYVANNDSFTYILPAGTAIENALSGYMDETDLHRDYTHLTDYGRLISAHTLYCFLTGVEHLDSVNLDAIPKAFLKSTKDKTQDRVLTYGEKQLLLEAVNNTIQNPLDITQSRYTVEPLEDVVPTPMSRPDYTVSQNPTTTELRQTAVRAMEDMLTIPWSTDVAVTYNKTGAVSDKNYYHNPNTIYCGLPYADGQTNIYVWMEYYDQQTGKFRMEGDGQWFNANVGNTCTGSLMWAWSTVCDSLTGNFVNTSMVYKYGCLPVGNYTYPGMTTINSYYDYGTDQVCAYNGAEVIYGCYAQMLPADAVTSSTSAHAMMVKTAPVVVYNTDGSINPDKSYVYVQDQRAGSGDKFYEITDPNGNVCHYSGRTNQKFTFTQLYKNSYIPVTTAEFLGQDAYSANSVTFSLDRCTTVQQLCQGSVITNYPMSLLKVNVTDEAGNTRTAHTVYFNRKDVQSGKARNYALANGQAEILETLQSLPSGTYTVTVEITAPNGEVFTPVIFVHTK